MSNPNPEILEQTDEMVDLKPPSMYNVVFYNDDRTSFEFVISVLIELYNKTASDASSIAMDIHNNGSRVVGVYPYDIASHKANSTIKLARHYNYPLQCEVVEE